jgi:hypothetical protein
MMQDSDQIVDEPPSGYGARLCIRYELPRKANDSGQTNFSVDTTASLSPHFGRSNEMKWKDFEDHARFHMGRFLGTTFDEKQPPEFPKRFDLVSPDGMIIGDAKFLTLVNGSKLPPAKFMKIAGHVWLLEHTTAKQKFLVFGNQREVAEWWLKKYGCLKTEVDFYFLDRSGNITNLKERLPIIVYMQRLNNALTDGS